MIDTKQVLQRMCESGILPVFRTNNLQHLFPASRAFYDAGIGCVEYTMTMPGALALIREARSRLPKDLFLGAGTVMDAKSVAQAVKAGATFIASPGFAPEVVKACKRHKVVSVVGAMTPTEMMEALSLGADVIKVFPANAVSPAFFAEVLGPFPGVCLMAAGGINLANVRDFVAAGAQIVTLLGNGVDAEAYASGDSAAITRAARKFVKAVQEARSSRLKR
jgi:2-dehydro-3-deoxyphosphogluconate aldolase/(4S)-4-hydroxy-2-oxoglutarate aldolase